MGALSKSQRGDRADVRAYAHQTAAELSAKSGTARAALLCKGLWVME